MSPPGEAMVESRREVRGEASVPGEATSDTHSISVLKVIPFLESDVAEYPRAEA